MTIIKFELNTGGNGMLCFQYEQLKFQRSMLRQILQTLWILLHRFWKSSWNLYNFQFKVNCLEDLDEFKNLLQNSCQT